MFTLQIQHKMTKLTKSNSPRDGTLMLEAANSYIPSCQQHLRVSGASYDRATATHLNLQSQEVCSSYIDRINFKVLLGDGNRIVNPQGIF